LAPGHFSADFTTNNSATLARNPDYWGYDERYPENKLPYVDAIKFLIIPDEDSAMAALCAGKIDILSGVTAEQAFKVQRTNPEILQISNPTRQAITIQPRNDRAPFNDIRVRKAMQLALDLPSIARDYYHGSASLYPSSYCQVTSQNACRGGASLTKHGRKTEGRIRLRSGEGTAITRRCRLSHRFPDEHRGGYRFGHGIVSDHQSSLPISVSKWK